MAHLDSIRLLADVLKFPLRISPVELQTVPTIEQASDWMMINLFKGDAEEALGCRSATPTAASQLQAPIKTFRSLPPSTFRRLPQESSDCAGDQQPRGCREPISLAPTSVMIEETC